MKTQVKVIEVADPRKIELLINNWLNTEDDISLINLNILPLMVGNSLDLLVVIVYSKEGWR